MIPKPHSLSILFGFLFLCLPSCSSSPYLQDVSKDFSEVVEVSFGLARGVGAHARVTPLAQLGFGSTNGDWVGLKEGRFAKWREERSELGISLLYMHDFFRWRTDDLVEFRSPLSGEEGYQTYPWSLSRLTDRGWFDIGLRANVIYLGFDIAVKLDELVDSFAGLVNVDLLQDDAFRPTYEDLLSRASSENSSERYKAIRALRWRTEERFGYEALTTPDTVTDKQGRALALWKNGRFQ